MIKHLILCVESNKEKQIDKLYIDKTLKLLYNIDNNVIIKYCFFSGKGNYEKKDILNSINKDLKQSPADEKIVVYFIDTDNYDTDSSDVILNQKIQNFCIQHSYELVWFCKNIEDVFWHNRIHSSEKVKFGKKFNRENSLQNATTQSLSTNSFSMNKSNFMLVFNNILDRKE